MNKGYDNLSERTLILAPQGRDAFVAARILGEAGLVSEICDDLPRLLRELTLGAGLAVITEDSIRSADVKGLANWTGGQPPWSDFPFVLLTHQGGGPERNPDAARLSGIDIHAASALAFAAGGAIVGAGGVLISMFLTFSAAMGVVFTMKALIVVIMGGVGNMLGALVAGLLLGISETAVARLVDPGLTIAVTYALFLSVLLWRPTGSLRARH